MLRVKGHRAPAGGNLWKGTGLNCLDMFGQTLDWNGVELVGGGAAWCSMPHAPAAQNVARRSVVPWLAEVEERPVSVFATFALALACRFEAGLLAAAGAGSSSGTSAGAAAALAIDLGTAA